ncbi:hypothetical protein [Salipiger sp. PrR003]|nr:hypothetical protein [Salipiger sp. PrR003]
MNAILLACAIFLLHVTQAPALTADEMREVEKAGNEVRRLEL